MEPLLGGRLANPPPKVQEVWDSISTTHTPVEMALQWLWDQPEVSVVLSGMSTMGQVEQNVASATSSHQNTLSRQEQELVDQVRETYRTFQAIPCTKCWYCMPCPNGVYIPMNFHFYNYGLMYDHVSWSRFAYNGWGPLKDGQAALCVQCRECEEKCTQQIEISAWMPQVHAVLGEGQPYPTS